jgi:hypothetical protein
MIAPAFFANLFELDRSLLERIMPDSAQWVAEPARL